MGDSEEPGDNTDEDSVSDSDEESAGESDEGALLAKSLAYTIYKSRPSKLQRRIIAYLIQMRESPTPRTNDYMAFVMATSPSVKVNSVVKEWRKIKRFFTLDSREEYATFAGLINVPELVAAFKAAPILDTEMVKAASMPPPSAPLPPSPMTAGSERIAQDRARSSSFSSGYDSSGSSGSRHLTPAQVAQMQATFKTNFNNFDRMLYDAIKDRRYECSLHSFVIDDPAVVLGLFPDTKDQDELKRVLIGREDEVLPALSSAEMAFLEMYKMDPKDLEELYAKKGWSAVGDSMTERPSDEFKQLVHDCLNQLLKVYRRELMIIPQVPHESWIVNHLWGFLADALSSPQDVIIRPGEYPSLASMYRRNLDRPAQARQFGGHKVDGVAIVAPLRFEIMAIEASKKDEGPNTTKAMNGRMKLCKLTKDMHDYIRNKAKCNIREQLVTFGIQISGEEAGFFALRQRYGRFYQLCHEGSLVLDVLAKAFTIRKSLLSMVKVVYSSVTDNPSPDGHDIDHIAATLMSPQLTPMRPPPIVEQSS
ncbi:hypothetical protein BGW38_006369 [Lunasporangiospora selenospora]|uniref:Uncharacterized protein n=1 Tax=Lunasporangiospora selenospora TaxID=979761 RepID=A0A9P6KAZ8_9FUNG|nr:hypothetical protein BGW38_006369 [Lunasporangiospora selenospora]